MTKSEKAEIKQMLIRQKTVWDYLAEERREAIRNTVTKEAVASLDAAFAYSLTLPPRLESGFTEFYRTLARPRPK